MSEEIIEELKERIVKFIDDASDTDLDILSRQVDYMEERNSQYNKDIAFIKHLKSLTPEKALLEVNKCWYDDYKKLPFGLRKSLINKTVDINYQDEEGNTALHFIAKILSKTSELGRDDADRLFDLIDAGANPNILNKVGETALDLCFRQAYNEAKDHGYEEQYQCVYWLEIILCLVKAGAKLGKFVEKENENI